MNFGVSRPGWDLLVSAKSDVIAERVRTLGRVHRTHAHAECSALPTEFEQANVACLFGEWLRQCDILHSKVQDHRGNIRSVYESEQSWRDVDQYVIEELVGEDETLAAARDASRDAGLPDHEVAPNQAKLLALICQMTGARRVLEFGTLGGYSTIWFARAVGAEGHVTTLEVDEQYAKVAQANFERAAVADRINLVLGPAPRP